MNSPTEERVGVHRVFRQLRGGGEACRPWRQVGHEGSNSGSATS